MNAFGSILRFTSGAVVIGKLTSIELSGMSADVIDNTTHQSADGYKEFTQGLKDAGEISFEGKFSSGDAGQVALLAAFNTGAVTAVEIVLPDSSVWAANVIVTAPGDQSFPMDADGTFSGSMKISGKPSFTAAGSTSTVTFTVTAAVGGAAIEGAVVVFNGQTKTTGVAGTAVFTGVPYGDLTYGVTKATYVGEAAVITVNGATEAEAVTLALVA